MTEPSQYFKGRTVQEQMDEVIGYVDRRAEEVAAAKADDVLQPAEAAKTAAQAAAQEAEAAKNATIAALPTIQQDISDLKTENVALDGRLNTVELKVQTAEGNIVTIQGQIVDLQTADGQNVKINNVNQYAVGLTGNQNIYGIKYFENNLFANSFIVNQTKDSRVPSENKVFQIEVDALDGYTHYVAFNNGADGSRSINIVMFISENDVAFFNLTYTAQGEKKIFTNFQKPDGW